MLAGNRVGSGSPHARASRACGDGADGRRVVVRLTKEAERRLQRLSWIHLEELRTIEPTLAKPLLHFDGPAMGLIAPVALNRPG